MLWPSALGVRQPTLVIADATPTSAASVIGDAPVAAVLAGFDMPAKHCGATVLNRRHHLELIQAQMPGMGDPVDRAGSAEDVCDLK